MKKMKRKEKTIYFKSIWAEKSKEMFDDQLDALKDYLDKELITREEYEKAVLNLKRDYYKNRLTLTWICSQTPYNLCKTQKSHEWKRSTMPKSKQLKVTLRKWSGWKKKKSRKTGDTKKICRCEFCD